MALPTQDKPMPTEKYPVSELSLGDIVDLGWTDGYSVATVKNISKDGEITLFRPYVHTSDFSHSGGVSCYVGIEEFQICGGTVTLLKKGQPLK
jgi:hypothetical protein